MPMTRAYLRLAPVTAMLVVTSPAFAQSSKIDAGDTAWMIGATGLVLMMTIPGLALFYAGMNEGVATALDPDINMSGCRDLIFHVQEHRFTLPRIASVLAELDLDFVGFEWPDDDAPARYRARFPDDRALSDLAHWHEFELARPDTFVLMYQFWVRV